MRKVVITICSILLFSACSSAPSILTLPSPSPPEGIAGDDQAASKEVQPRPAEVGKHPTRSNLTDNPAADGEAAHSTVTYTINPRTYTIVNPQQPDEKIALLTFDDGPSGESTLQLLDVLDRHQVKSIWFVNGLQLATKQKDGTFTIKPEKADLLKEIRKRGHLVGNHTWWHENLRKLPPARQREEILSTSEIIEAILGESPRFFRPPFGAYTDISQEVCSETGMQSINWSVGSLDWDPKVYKQPGAISRQVLNHMHPGGNILFHDRTWTAKELDDVLGQLTKKGYRFVLPTEK
ncbi:MAG: polysaccharide deacetylase family protein [Brevibacillus sp.]|nr:polysaccharide deacetylase family protein [Brevibacillus sp.]